MFEKENIKIPFVSMYTTSGLVSILQMVDFTDNKIFFTNFRNDTSGIDVNQIVYSPIKIIVPENE